MSSVMRGSNRRLEAGRNPAVTGGAPRALLSWMLTNLWVHLSKSPDNSGKVLNLRYEDLVKHPVTTMERIGTFLGMDMSPLVEMIVNRSILDTEHGVAGNRMRRQLAVRLDNDEQWKTSLPKSARKLAMLSWPIAHKYGYNVLSID